MNTTQDDGGPTTSGMEVHTSGHSQRMFPVGGLSIRDWFAGMALQAIIAKHPTRYSATGDPIDLEMAQGAYDYADAMLAARKEAR